VSLSTQILLGLAGGIACGLFFGEQVAFLHWLGDAFVLLLQMTVLPYVLVSMIAALGQLDRRQALLLARSAGVFFLLLWALGLGLALALPLAFPAWQSASFFSQNLVQQAHSIDFLSLYIPANPFRSLADNVVPAVVLFSIAVGLALIGSSRRESVVVPLTALTEVLSQIAGFVIRLAPIGLFAIAGHAAGTMDLSQARALQVYMLSYAALALIAAFWILPGLVLALTPFRYRDVMGRARAALITSFATGNLFVVLPILAESAKQAVMEAEVARRDDSAVAMVDAVVPTSFNFPSVAKLLTLSFIPFAGWFTGFDLGPGQLPALLASGFMSFFGSTVVAVPFLLDLFRIPGDVFSMFLLADNLVGSRFGALLASVHTITITLLTAAMVAGLVRVRWRALARLAGVSLLLVVTALLGIRLGFEAMGDDYQQYHRFVGLDFAGPTVPARVLDKAPDPLPPVDPGATVLERISARGRLRVGYRTDSLPWVFRNQEGRLVGFDAAMAHRLASDLHVSLEFVRTEPGAMAELLNSGYLDLAVSGIAVTPERLLQVAFTTPVVEETLAFVVPDHRRDDFTSWRHLRTLHGLRLAVPPAPYYRRKIARELPQAKLVEIATPRAFFRSGAAFDGLAFGAKSGSAWSLVYPSFSVAVPQPDPLSVPLAYAVARDANRWRSFLDAWLELKRADRSIEQLEEHWILGKPDEERRPPRWSILRNVLGVGAGGTRGEGGDVRGG